MPLPAAVADHIRGKGDAADQKDEPKQGTFYEHRITSVAFTPGNGASTDHEAVVSAATLGTVSNVMIDASATVTFDYTPFGGPGDESLTVTLSAEGVIMIQTTETAAADLVPKLRAIAAERTSDKIYLRADGAIPYARVAEVMGALNAGGFRNIGLVTEPGGPTLDSGG